MRIEKAEEGDQRAVEKLAPEIRNVLMAALQVGKSCERCSRAPAVILRPRPKVRLLCRGCARHERVDRRWETVLAAARAAGYKG